MSILVRLVYERTRLSLTLRTYSVYGITLEPDVVWKGVIAEVAV